MGETVPQNFLVTAQKPDLVIIDRMEEKMDIFELTVPLETNVNAQNINTYDRISIGSRGYISPSNKANLKKLAA